MFRRLLLGSLAGLVLAGVADAKGPYGSIAIGNWRGGAYADDQTGGFSHCSATAPYRSGIFFMVILNSSWNWGLSFINKSWQLNPGEPFPAELTFDGQARITVAGKVVRPEQVVVAMPPSSALLAQFRKSNQMTVAAKGEVFAFNLPGTSQLMPTLVNCVTQMKTRGIASAGDFNVRPKTVVAAAPAAPRTGGSLSPEPSPDSQPNLQIEALELASNFILKTALQNPKVLSRAETPTEVAMTGAAWRSDEAMGFVRIVPPKEGVKGIDVAAAVAGNDAKDCKGKFASGRVSELVDSEVVFRGFASCEDSDGARFAQYFIVPRKKGGFVLFSVVSNMKTEQARAVTSEEKLGGFRKAALVAVGE